MGSGGSKTPNSVARSSSVPAAVVTPQKTIAERSEEAKERAYEQYSEIMNKYMNIPKRIEDVQGGLYYKEGTSKRIKEYVKAEMEGIEEIQGREALQEAKARFYRELREKLYGKPRIVTEKSYGKEYTYEVYTVNLSKLDPSNTNWHDIFNGDRDRYEKRVARAANEKWNSSEKYKGYLRYDIDTNPDPSWGKGVIMVEDFKTNSFGIVKPYISKSAKVDLVFSKGSTSLVSSNIDNNGGRGIIINGEGFNSLTKAIKFKTIGVGNID